MDPLTSSFLANRPMILRWLARSFPSARPEDVEDALSDAYVALLARRCTDDVDRLLRCATWRALRGLFRRQYRRMEMLPGELPAIGSLPGQDALLGLRDWCRTLTRVCRRFAPANTDTLRRALLDSLHTGDEDTAVALRHGLRREPLNRARNALLDEVLPTRPRRRVA